MIEIITDKVDMPPLGDRRYQLEELNDKWLVRDTNEAIIRYKGVYESAAIACHNLNKLFYRSIEPVTNEDLEIAGFDKLRRLYLSNSFEYPIDNPPKLYAITNEDFELSRSGIAAFHFKIKTRQQLFAIIQIFKQ